MPTMKQRLAAPAVLVSLTGIPEMRGVCRNGDALEIGAATTHAEVAREAAAVYPGSRQPCRRHRRPGGPQRRHRRRQPRQQRPRRLLPAAALGSGATIVTNTREIAADGLQGLFSTALDAGEIIISVRFPIPERGGYAKFEQPASRFALTGAFVAKFGSGVRVAITGAGEDGVFRWSEAGAVRDLCGRGAGQPYGLAGRADGRSARNAGLSRQPREGDDSAHRPRFLIPGTADRTPPHRGGASTFRGRERARNPAVQLSVAQRAYWL